MIAALELLLFIGIAFAIVVLVQRMRTGDRDGAGSDLEALETMQRGLRRMEERVDALEVLLKEPPRTPRPSEEEADHDHRAH
jgi:phage shock protein B